VAAGDLTSLANVRLHMGLDSAQTDFDTLLTALVTQASTAIKRYAGREFAPQTSAGTARVFRYEGGGYLSFAPYDATTITAVAIDTDTSSSTSLTLDTDYFLWPVNKNDTVWTGMQIRGFSVPSRTSSHEYKPYREITITGTWGFAAVPGDVELAANILVKWWYEQQTTTPGGQLGDLSSRFGPVLWPTAVRQLLDHWRVVQV